MWIYLVDDLDVLRVFPDQNVAFDVPLAPVDYLPHPDDLKAGIARHCWGKHVVVIAQTNQAALVVVGHRLVVARGKPFRDQLPGIAYPAQHRVPRPIDVVVSKVMVIDDYDALVAALTLVALLVYSPKVPVDRSDPTLVYPSVIRILDHHRRAVVFCKSILRMASNLVPVSRIDYNWFA
ncbi:MAG: hypothetical protein JPMHGGIA_00985 [Saprospiraceae bacterium]|nr:hypothetical protein [Saprospiraceae bacterium]